MTSNDFSSYVVISDSSGAWWGTYADLARHKGALVRFDAWQSATPETDVLALQAERADFYALMETDIFYPETPDFASYRTDPENHPTKGSYVLLDDAAAVIKRVNQPLMDPRVQGWQDDWIAYLKARERGQACTVADVNGTGFSFVDGGGGADTIVRFDGGSWLAEGYTAGNTLTSKEAENSANDFTTSIVSLTEDTLTLATAIVTAATADNSARFESPHVLSGTSGVVIRYLQEKWNPAWGNYPANYDEDEWRAANQAFLDRLIAEGFISEVYFGNFGFTDYTQQGDDDRPRAFLGETTHGVCYYANDADADGTFADLDDARREFFFEDLQRVMTEIHEDQSGKRFFLEVALQDETNNEDVGFFFGCYLLWQWESSAMTYYDTNRTAHYYLTSWFDLVTANLGGDNDAFTPPAYEIESGVWIREFIESSAIGRATTNLIWTANATNGDTIELTDAAVTPVTVTFELRSTGEATPGNVKVVIGATAADTALNFYLAVIGHGSLAITATNITNLVSLQQVDAGAQGNTAVTLVVTAQPAVVSDFSGGTLAADQRRILLVNANRHASFVPLPGENTWIGLIDTSARQSQHFTTGFQAEFLTEVVT